MVGLFLTLGGVVLITFVSSPTLGAGWSWDFANGLGFVAFGGLLYLTLASGPVGNLRAHQVLGYALLGLVTVHVFWLLLIDPVVVEYVLPGAPIYMWMGVGGLLLLIALIAIGLPQYRARLHQHYASFRYWHRVLALAAIGATGYHIVGSNFYLHTWPQVVLFVALAATVCFAGRRLPVTAVISHRTARLYLGIGALATLAFAGVRNVPL